MNRPSADAQTPSDEVTDARTVNHDCLCIQCRYNVCGLATDGVCPECGMSIALSHRGYLLAWSITTYRSTLRSGLSTVLIGLAFLVIVIFTSVALLAAMPSLSVLIACVLVAFNMLLLFGYWRYATPDPRNAPYEWAFSARRLVRAAVIAQWATTGVGSLVWIVQRMFLGGSVGAGSSPLWNMIDTSIVNIAAAAWALQFISVLLYTRGLAHRMPDPRLANWCGTCLWLLPVLSLAWILPAIATYVISRSFSIMAILMLIVGPLLALLMYWNIIYSVRSHLDKLARTPPR